jgi:hypothetical protein
MRSKEISCRISFWHCELQNESNECGLHHSFIVGYGISAETTSSLHFTFFLSCWPRAWHISACCLRVRVSSPGYSKSVLRLINWNEHSFAFPRCSKSDPPLSVLPKRAVLLGWLRTDTVGTPDFAYLGQVKEHRCSQD